MTIHLPDTFSDMVTPLPGDHWQWEGQRNYGRATGAPKYRNENAQRWVYTYVVGPLPTGMPYVVSTCGVKDCVNPAHLKPSGKTTEKGGKAAGLVLNGDQLGRIEEKLDLILAMLDPDGQQADVVQAREPEPVTSVEPEPVAQMERVNTDVFPLSQDAMPRPIPTGERPVFADTALNAWCPACESACGLPVEASGWWVRHRCGAWLVAA